MLKIKFVKAFLAISVAALLIMPLAGCGTSKILESGATWEVAETTQLASLTIAEDATIKAPDGYNVTMTVDGVGTPIAAGTYKGKVVLSITKEIQMSGAQGGPPGGGGAPPGGDREGAPGGERAGAAPGGGAAGADRGAARGGERAGAPGAVPGEARGGEMAGGTPPGGDRGGLPGGEPGGRGQSAPFKATIYVENGKYMPEQSVAAAVTGGKVSDTSAENVKIASNEGRFNGIIVTGDTPSTYAIDNPEITLTGNGGDDASGLGSGIMVSGKAEVTINNAKINNTGANRSAVFVSGEGVIHVNDSEIEVHNGPNDSSGSFSAGGVMMAGPWLLGITGNVRATNIVESGTAYYTNTHIKSQAWGALSTDGPVKIRLNATKCVIETDESGYGAYSIGDCINTFSNCTFNVADYGVILCDNSSDIFTDATVVNSKRIGVMMHTGTGSGKLVIEKGSEFNTKDTVIQVKGRGIDIFVDDATLNTESGVILQSMANDDPFFTAGMGDTMGAKGFSKDVNATFSNVTLTGDIINSDTVGTVKQPLGPNGEKLTLQTPELYYLIGQTINTYCATNDPFGVTVELDGKSTWIVGKTSYLTNLSIAEGAVVKAPEGYTLTMTIGGAKKAIAPGVYKGKIVLAVAKSS